MDKNILMEFSQKRKWWGVGWNWPLTVLGLILLRIAFVLRKWEGRTVFFIFPWKSVLEGFAFSFVSRLSGCVLLLMLCF